VLVGSFDFEPLHEVLAKAKKKDVGIGRRATLGIGIDLSHHLGKGLVLLAHALS
jgi:hypothetical protein